MESSLKACPFCGHPAALGSTKQNLFTPEPRALEGWNDPPGWPECFWVSCTKCCGSTNKISESAQEVADSWNQRAA